MPGLRPEDLLQPTPRGLYCPPADIYIDPLRPVGKALVTHGHSDHARAGHGAVLATAPTLAVMAIRYGEDFAGTTQTARWREPIAINGVQFSFHPAGHIHGSAQIAVTHAGLTIVVSGDYKRASDPTAEPFEVVRTHVFITEATFGLPVFRHPAASGEVARLVASLALFPERTHVVGAYALGKAQRLMALIRAAGHDRPIFIHGAMEKLTQFYESEGFDFGAVRLVREATRAELAGAIVIGPPGSAKDLWARRFADPVTAFASGWMRVRARAKQGGIELPLVISDHADWDELGRTILDTGAGEVWVTHGQEDALVHWSGLRGLKAKPLRLVGYGDEGEAEPEGAADEAGSPA